MKNIKKERKKDKKSKSALLGMAVMLALAACVGYFCGSFFEFPSQEVSGTELVLMLVAIAFVAYAMFIVQIIVHEAGHLVFGLISGYKFSSFRIANLIVVNDGDKLRLKKVSITGTAGQCLMSPPELKNKKIPYVLYNLGGVIMNIIVSIIAIILCLTLKKYTFAANTFMLLSACGIFTAISNGIPMRLGTVDNDGYNAVSLGKDTDALYAFWAQLKINEMNSLGVRLKDMPEEWFAYAEKLENPMIAALAVFNCNRLMDKKEFEEAELRINELLDGENGMIGLHRNLLVCDKIYCELIFENRKEEIEKLMGKEQKAFMRSMKNFPTVLRTEYLLAKYVYNDSAKAEKTMAEFERISKNYPYKTDIESEKELIELIRLRRSEE